jgi:competence protein ComEC
MLIDGGPVYSRYKLINYLQRKNITKLDYVVATHPHADHIGGLEAVIRNFDIGKIIMPRVSHDTIVYRNFLQAIADENILVQEPVAGSVFMMGDIKFQIIGPISDFYTNLNDYSIVIRMEYGNTSFLFTGDIERVAEQEILRSNKNISADVLKVAHHGSRTSSNKEFIRRVNPMASVITVGLNNQFNLPSDETIYTLQYFNSKILRTDLMGTIVMKTDGEYISYTIER